MRCITDVRRIILSPLLYLALSVILPQSAVIGAPVGSAPRRIDYFSPVLGARFEIVQVGLVKGARLVEEPVAGSPLEGKGLIVGDMITHLDGDPVLHTGGLELHEQNTKVSWVADQTQVTRSLDIFIQRGKRFTDPSGLGPNVGIVGPPINLGANIAGEWNCSCGALWTLAQRGNAVTGNESDAQSNNRVSGTFTGLTFNFSYFHQDGYSGTGTFTANNALTSMTGTIRWDNGTTSRPTLKRVVAGPGPRPNPNTGIGTQYTVVGLRNNSNQFVDCELRWNGGAWQDVQLNAGASWTYWTQGHGQRAQLRINMDRTGGQDIQVINLSGAGVTVQGDPTFRDASVYGISVISGQVAISQ